MFLSMHRKERVQNSGVFNLCQRAAMQKRAGSGCSVFFFSSRRRHTRLQGDWSSDVCSSDLAPSQDGSRGVPPIASSPRSSMRSLRSPPSCSRSFGSSPSTSARASPRSSSRLRSRGGGASAARRARRSSRCKAGPSSRPDARPACPSSRCSRGTFCQTSCPSSRCRARSLRGRFDRTPIALGRVLSWRSLAAIAAVLVAMRVVTPMLGPAGSYVPIARSFDAPRAAQHLAYIGDPAREGRFSGSPGYIAAAQYVADRFKEIGLQPLETGSYFQSFKQSVVRITATPTFEIAGAEAKSFTHRVDFTERLGGRAAGRTAGGNHLV